jgi:hypothetical protein
VDAHRDHLRRRESRFYINGALVATKAQTGTIAVAISRCASRQQRLGEFFRGVIDEVRIYNRALSLARSERT